MNTSVNFIAHMFAVHNSIWKELLLAQSKINVQSVL